MGRPKSGHSAETLAKLRKAVKLRERGYTYKQVAQACGYSAHGSAYTVIKRYMLETGRHMDDLKQYRDS